MMEPEEWREAVLARLEAAGPVCQHAARYIREHNVPIGFARQSTGARWTWKGAIELSADHYSLATSPANALMLAAIVHEATHLEQGVALALSVEGELLGWKAEQEALAELGLRAKHAHWAPVTMMPARPSDDELRRTRAEMVRIAGWRYLIWLLPLRPNFWTRLVDRLQKFERRLAARSSAAAQKAETDESRG